MCGELRIINVLAMVIPLPPPYGVQPWQHENAENQTTQQVIALGKVFKRGGAVYVDVEQKVMPKVVAMESKKSIFLSSV